MADTAVLRLVLSLFFIIALILAGAWITRRAGWLRTRSNQAIKVVSTQTLGPRTYVALVEIENTRLVLGVTTNQISLLHTLPDATNDLATSAPEQAGRAVSFPGALKLIMAKRR